MKPLICNFARHWLLILLLALAFTLWAQISKAEEPEPLPSAKGEVVLRVTGDISLSNTKEGAAEFDIEMLEKLNPVVVQTQTIWTKDVIAFTGVPYINIINRLGIDPNSDTKISAIAMNDYHIELPLDDAVENGAILAYYKDGSLMSVRDKGPIWVVYPFDEFPKFQSEVYYSRSIWQLVELHVEAQP